MRLLVIGLDGLTFDVVNPLIEMGHLPNVARLMGEGSKSPLLSTVPTLSPVAWSSFITGQSPGDHGVYAWGIKTSDYRISLINANYLQDQSIWSTLHQAGKRIGVIGLPMSYPPHPYPSFMVGGPLSPGVHSSFTFPDSLYQELKKNVGEYIIDLDKKQLLAEGEEGIVAALSRMVRVRGEATLYLLQEYPWDVLTAVFVATDRLQHCLWHHFSFAQPFTGIQRSIVGFYDLIDEYIGRLIDVTPDPKTVVLLSDHGFGPGKRKISLNGWLLREGYLRRGESVQGKRMRQQVLAAANRVGLTRTQIKEWLGRVGLLDILGSRLDEVSTYETAFDWQRSIAFAGGQGIFLNVRGREREGIVPPGRDYERMRKEIAEKLLALQDPETGERAFEQVRYREELYDGRRVGMAPDVVPLPREGYEVRAQFYEKSSRRIREGVFDTPGEWGRGMHRPEGILVASGDQIEQGVRLQELPHIWDVTPFLLALSGVPIPAGMTGQVPVELIKPAYRKRIEYTDKSERTGQERDGALWDSESDEHLVEERLRGLGYLE